MSETTLEKHYDDQEHHARPLSRQVTYNLSEAQFEKLYLQSGGEKSKGDLTSRFGNPTSIGLLSFLVCLSSLSVELMGWGGVTPNSDLIVVGACYYVGGLGLFTAGLLEWVLGNTFTSTVFVSFGLFFPAFGFILQPTELIGASLGEKSLDYNGGVAIFLTAWSFLGLLYTIASLRTNVVYFALWVFFEGTFWSLVAAYWHIGHGGTHGRTILKIAGSFAFLTQSSGWYLLAVNIFTTAGLPVAKYLPVGDLSWFLAPERDEQV